jgi:hypothetical protein
MSPIKNYLNIKPRRTEAETFIENKLKGMTEKQKEEFLDWKPNIPTALIRHEIQDYQMENPNHFFLISSTEDPHRNSLLKEMKYEECDVGLMFNVNTHYKFRPKTNDVDLVALDLETGRLYYNHIGETLYVSGFGLFVLIVRRSTC